MLDLLLDETFFLLLLAFWAVAAPVGAWLALKRPGNRTRRPWIALGISGPGVLVLWLLYNVILAVLGFATIASVIVVLGLGAAIGVGAGLWIRSEPPPATE